MSETPIHLKFDDVSKHYGTVRAVNHVSIDIHREEFLTLLGASGSGKTTMLMTIAGFTVPDGGHIILDGEDITFTPPHRRNIGIVFQNYALFPHMSVFENVAYPAACSPNTAQRDRGKSGGRPRTGALGRPWWALSPSVERRPAAACSFGPRARLRAQTPAHGRTPGGAGQETARAHATQRSSTFSAI